MVALLGLEEAKAEYIPSYSFPTGLEESGDNWLALRSHPTTREGVRLRKLGPGTLFTVTHRQGAWYSIRLLDGETGWVYSRYVGCCASVPSKATPVASISAANPPPSIVQFNNIESVQLREKVEALTALVRAGQERNESQAVANRPSSVITTPTIRGDTPISNESTPARELGGATKVEAHENSRKPESENAAPIDEEALTRMAERFEEAAINRTIYATPIRPDDKDLGRTARVASEQFPKVPFYIPGTRESGRFWVEPRVSNEGKLFYDVIFVDPRASVDQKRAVIDLTPEQLERTKVSISKLSDWSAIAHKNELRRSYRKRVDCFPEINCPRENEKIEGKTSTEIIFIVAEDGSTAGRIQRNKGRYDEGYNISIKSSKLLSSYLHYVQSQGERDFVAGTRTTADIDAMFK